MRLVGKTTVGSAAVALAADTKRVGRVSCPLACRVPKLSAYLDGLGPGSGASGSQGVRGVIFDAAGSLVVESDEVQVAPGQAPAWIDLPLSAFPEGVPLAAADYDFGVHVGAQTNTARIYSDDPGGRGGRWNADAYADGASDPFGAATPTTGDLSIFAPYVTPWSPPDNVDDFYLGALPFAQAQAALAADGIARVAVGRATCGWHGDRFDPREGSFCLVQTGGPLADLVGERLRITRRGRGFTRSVAAYCVADAAILEDVSVTRRLFLALGLPSLDDVIVRIEVYTP